MGYGSNRGRPSEIGRPGWFGRVGAARLTGNASPAAALRRRKPNRRPRGRFGRGLALEPARDMRNPLEVDSRGCRVRSVVHGDEGGSGR